MKILIITQDEPFFLKKNLEYFFSMLPKDIEIVGCILSSVSPFGVKESFFKKAVKTLKIFGINFFAFYSYQYILNKLNKMSIGKFLRSVGINQIKLKGSINSESNLKIIRSYKPDIIVSILGNQIFKSQLINIPSKGCINLHTALLPKYRGLMPTFWVLKNNEKFTGVSVFFMDEGIDSGPIIIQKKIKIETNIHRELITLTKKIGMEALVEAIMNIKDGKVKLKDNIHKKMSYYSFPKRPDVIDFYNSGKKFF